MDTLITNARDFDRKNHTISLGVCAPAPVWTLAPLITNMYHHMALRTETKPEGHLFTGLLNNTYQLIATHIKPVDTQFYFQKCGSETLLFALPKEHKYVQRKSLSFTDMNGENMLLMPDIGFWNFVKENSPSYLFLCCVS